MESQDGAMTNADLLTNTGRCRTRLPGPVVFVRSKQPTNPCGVHRKETGFRPDRSCERAAVHSFKSLKNASPRATNSSKAPASGGHPPLDPWCSDQQNF